MWALKGAAARGTGIGCMIGMIPGAGATVGAVIAYGVEKQVSPRGAEFGTGVEAGLVAPEAAKNATTGAAMIPLLTLGIPGSAATAIMLAALVLHGVTPGPLLFATQTDMVYTIFASLLLANLCMIGAGVLVARGFASLMKVPPTVLGAFIVVLSVVGAFGVRNNIADVYICLSFGVIGYLMKRYDFPSAPLVLGVILGPLAERYFMTSLANYDNDLTIFFTRPISATILGFAGLFVLWALVPDMKGKVMRLIARKSRSMKEVQETVAALVARARAAQRIADGYDQARVDEIVTAAGWAIIEPARNRALAELAVADTGIGSVDDKIRKNHRKTLGLLRDLAGAKSVGVIAEDAARGLIEIARPVGVVCAITPSTNPAATPANKIINALKGRNAVIVAPSPKGWSTAAKLVEFIHAQFDRIGAPRDLVQLLPAPVTKQSTAELMRQCDLVVATGSGANVRAAYTSGTPAFGVGAGNVAGIVDETADVDAAAERIVRSKTFDNATSCSSENSVVVVEAVRAEAAGGTRGARRGAARRRAEGRAAAAHVARRQAVVGGDRPVGATRSPNRPVSADCAGADLRVLMVDEDAQRGFGADYPFSGEKLSPVLTLYTARDFADAARIVERIYAFQGAGHSVGLHSASAERALQLGLTLPVSRVIFNQAHCIATGGSFDNGLPFSLSMGCGTWGRNNFSDNMNYRHYLNITRVSAPIAEQVPSEAEIFGAYFARYGKA